MTASWRLSPNESNPKRTSASCWAWAGGPASETRPRPNWAFVVVDKWQGGGLGTELMRRLLLVARAEKIHRIVAHILSENASMAALARRFHFVCVPDDDPISLTATLDLKDLPPSA